MILADRFVFLHIGKTGGDACKQLVRELNLPNIYCYDIRDPKKHVELHSVISMRGKDLIMTIRRLPAREISWYHAVVDDGNVEPQEDIAQFLIQTANSDFDLKRHQPLGAVEKIKFVRQECLRSDLMKVLSSYYSLSHTQRNRILKAETKAPMRYDHDIHKYFTSEQLVQLYKANPLYSSLEKLAYGNLLVPLD